MRPIKLAAYLDEAGDDPASSCSVLIKNDIRYVALRQLWANNITNLSDDACQQTLKLLKDHELTPILLASDVGMMLPASQLIRAEQQLNRLLDLAQYFKSQYVRVGVGLQEKNSDAAVKQWMQHVQEKSIVAGITPVLELTHGSSLFGTVELVTMLARFRRWKLLYDPAQLIIKQVMDPFVKYWPLIKQSVVALDIHDFKIGHGHKPAGYGDARIKQTINDAASFLPECWYFLEPGLGRKYGSALTKSDVFKLALDAMVALESKQ